MSSVGLQPDKQAHSRPAASFPVPHALSCLYILLLLLLTGMDSFEATDALPPVRRD